MAVNIDYGAGRGLSGMYQNLLNIQQQGYQQMAEKDRRQQDIINQAFRAGGGFLRSYQDQKAEEAKAAGETDYTAATESLKGKFESELPLYEKAVEMAGTPEAKIQAEKDLANFRQSYQSGLDAITSQYSERQKLYGESGFGGMFREGELLSGKYRMPELYSIGEQEMAGEEKSAVEKARMDDLIASTAAQIKGEQKDANFANAKSRAEYAKKLAQAKSDELSDIGDQRRSAEALYEYGASRRAGEQIDKSVAALNRRATRDASAADELRRQQPVVQQRAAASRQAGDYIAGLEKKAKEQKVDQQVKALAGGRDQSISNARDAAIAADKQRSAGFLKTAQSLIAESERIDPGNSFEDFLADPQNTDTAIKQGISVKELFESQKAESERLRNTAYQYEDLAAEKREPKYSDARMAAEKGFLAAEGRIDRSPADTSEREALRKQSAQDLTSSKKLGLQAEKLDRRSAIFGLTADEMRSGRILPAGLEQTDAGAAERTDARLREEIGQKGRELTMAQQLADSTQAKVQALENARKAGKAEVAGEMTATQEALQQAEANLAEKEAEIKEGFITLPSGRMIPKGETAAAVAEEERLKLKREAEDQRLLERSEYLTDKSMEEQRKIEAEERAYGRLQEGEKRAYDRLKETEERELGRTLSAEERAELRRQAIAEANRTAEYEKAAFNEMLKSDDTAALDTYLETANLPPAVQEAMRASVGKNRIATDKSDAEKARQVHKDVYDSYIALGDDPKGAFEYGQTHGLIPPDAKWNDKAATDQILQQVDLLTDSDKAGEILFSLYGQGKITTDQYDAGVALAEQRGDLTKAQRTKELISLGILSGEQAFTALQKTPEFSGVMGKMTYQEFKDSKDKLDFYARTGQPLDAEFLNKIGIAEENHAAFNANNTYKYNAQQYAPVEKQFLTAVEGALSEAKNPVGGGYSQSRGEAAIRRLIADPRYAKMAQFYGYDQDDIISKIATDKGSKIAQLRAQSAKDALDARKTVAEIAKLEREGKGGVSQSDLDKEFFRVYNDASKELISQGVDPVDVASGAGFIANNARRLLALNGKGMTIEEITQAVQRQTGNTGQAPPPPPEPDRGTGFVTGLGSGRSKFPEIIEGPRRGETDAAYRKRVEAQRFGKSEPKKISKDYLRTLYGKKGQSDADWEKDLPSVIKKAQEAGYIIE